MRRLLAFLIVASAPIGVASAEEQLLAIKPGGPYAAIPGGEIARINKQRALPNAFGFGDIFGRKVDSGFTQLIFFGRAENGHAMIRRIDIEIHSTATTMSRTPGFIHGQAYATGQAWGTYSGGYGTYSSSSTGRAQVFGMTPTEETNTVLPPRITDFLADPTQPIQLPTGHLVEFHAVEPQRALFSIKEARAAPKRGKRPKGGANGKPDWVPW